MVWSGKSLIFGLIKTLIRLKFPHVQSKTTATLAQELADPARSQPLILDARTGAEYEVSHLDTAQQMDGAADLTRAAMLKNVSKTRPIVVYCSVGYRSAVLAQRLQDMGFQDVANLEGGLFQWANEDRAIVRAGQPTHRVHPYNSLWRALLKRQKR